MTAALLVITDMLLPVALTLAGFAAGLLLRHVLVARLRPAARAAPSPIADLVVAALRGPVTVWSTIIGLYVAAEVAALPPGVGRVVRQTLLVLVILSVTWALAGVAAALVERAAVRARGALPSTSLITNLARIAVLAVGILIALQALNISITPLITALGVGGLAVGLALQETLGNLFAGIHIVTSRQIRPGDFVRLSSGEEGYVQDVTWRYTTIRQLPNTLTIVPNAKLASAVTTNYSLPEPELAVLLDVTVGYDSDLDHVERVTIDVARQVLRGVPGGVPDFEPFIRYASFGESGIRFSVILRGREVTDQYLIRHEFIKRLHARYRAEGIVMPFPQRTLHLPQAAERASRSANELRSFVTEGGMGSSRR